MENENTTYITTDMLNRAGCNFITIIIAGLAIITIIFMDKFAGIMMLIISLLLLFAPEETFNG